MILLTHLKCGCATIDKNSCLQDDDEAEQYDQLDMDTIDENPLTATKKRSAPSRIFPNCHIILWSQKTVKGFSLDPCTRSDEFCISTYRGLGMRWVFQDQDSKRCSEKLERSSRNRSVMEVYVNSIQYCLSMKSGYLYCWQNEVKLHKIPVYVWDHELEIAWWIATKS